jgi:HSP20 family protein
MGTTMAAQEIQVQEKKEIERKEESTIPARIFVPVADIFETDTELTVALEMPGVTKNSVDVELDKGILTISGKIDFSKYENLRPLYTEYNIGNYSRSFQISSEIKQEAIKAELKDGVMTLVLPKTEKAKPRRIPVD